MCRAFLMRRHEDAEPAGAPGAGGARIALRDVAQLLRAGVGERFPFRLAGERFDFERLGRERELHAQGMGEAYDLQKKMRWRSTNSVDQSGTLKKK